MAETKKELRDIDKPFYHYWQALYHAFFNNRLYVDVGKRWKGLGLAYFLFLMFIITIPFCLREAWYFNKFFMEDLVTPLVQVPPIYIQNGKVSFDKPMPYFIKNGQNQIVSIIDTTGTVKSIDGSYPYLHTLVTKDKIFYRFPTPQFFFDASPPHKMETPIFQKSFDPHMNAVFDGREWVKSAGLMGLKNFMIFLVYPVISLIFLAIFGVLFLAMALMGQFVAHLLKFPISYKQASRLLFVSVTPAMTVLWLALTMGWAGKAALGIILPGLLAFYFCYAVLSLKRESNKLVVS